MKLKTINDYRLEAVAEASSLIKFIPIWQQSFAKGEFIVGDFLINRLRDLDCHDWLLSLSSRGFSKSFSCQMMLAYSVLTTPKDLRIGYFSSTPQQANSHLRKLKQLMEINPFFNQLTKDLKPTAENIIRYKNHHNAITEIRPHGLTTSIRGEHYRGGIAVLDDVLRDAAGNNILTAANVDLINRTIKKVITPMLHQNTKIVFIGTPLTSRDIFSDTEYFKDFHCVKTPALDEHDESVFPELYPTAFLHARRNQIGRAEFQAEYMCEPMAESDAFFNYDDLKACINPKLSNLEYYRGKCEVIAGVDIAVSKKSQHATHMAIFKKYKDRLIQLLSIWFEGMPITSQLIAYKRLIKDFNISQLFADNTNKWLDFAFENGSAPSELIPLHITRVTKNSMASTLDTLITHKQIQLINDERQINQLMLVQSDLSISVNRQGHGDSFTSLGFVAMHGFTPKPFLEVIEL